MADYISRENDQVCLHIPGLACRLWSYEFMYIIPPPPLSPLSFPLILLPSSLDSYEVPQNARRNFGSSVLGLHFGPRMASVSVHAEPALRASIVPWERRRIDIQRGDHRTPLQWLPRVAGHRMRRCLTYPVGSTTCFICCNVLLCEGRAILGSWYSCAFSFYWIGRFWLLIVHLHTDFVSCFTGEVRAILITECYYLSCFFVWYYLRRTTLTHKVWLPRSEQGLSIQTIQIRSRKCLSASQPVVTSLEEF